jgi:hypothetical protein
MTHSIHIHNVLFQKEIMQKLMVELMYLIVKNSIKIDLKYVKLMKRLIFHPEPRIVIKCIQMIDIGFETPFGKKTPYNLLDLSVSSESIVSTSDDRCAELGSYSLP